MKKPNPNANPILTPNPNPNHPNPNPDPNLGVEARVDEEAVHVRAERVGAQQGGEPGQGRGTVERGSG